MLYHVGFVISLALTLGADATNPKRGLALAEADGRDVPQFMQAGSTISWVYDWDSSQPSYLAADPVDYVPMQWGVANINNFAAAAGVNNCQHPKAILGFNEPDMDSQSHINSTYAAQLWLEYIQPLKSTGVLIGAPAISSAPTGRPWLADFLAQCTGCTIDFIPIHWYGTGIGNFYDYIWSIHGQFPSYPLWVTEFADTSSNNADVVDFLNQTIRYMDTLSWVERYSWFGFFRGDSGDSTVHYNLLDDNGNLNTLGRLYGYGV